MKVIVLAAQHAETYYEGSAGATAIHLGASRVRMDRVSNGESILHLAVIAAELPIGTREMPFSLRVLGEDGELFAGPVGGEFSIRPRVETTVKVVTITHQLPAGRYAIECMLGNGEVSDRTFIELYEADPHPG